MKVEHRPPALEGATKVIRTSCGNLYVTCNFIFDKDEGEYKAIEVFFNMGKAGSCQNSYLYSLAITLSQAARAGADMRTLAHKLLGIICPKPEPGEPSDASRVLSCADAAGKGIIYVIDNYNEINKDVTIKKKGLSLNNKTIKEDISPIEKQKRVKEAVMSGICPLCGGQLLKRSGCEECANPACDFSECG